MKGFILSVAVLFSTTFSFGQIVIGGDTQPAEKKEEKQKSDTLSKKTKTVDGSTSAYFVANWSKANRVLTENGPDFGDTLGKRADEGSLNVWSFGIGIQNQINRYLMWDGGISIIRNGESYDYVGSDTTFSYQTYYNYIAMPVRINYTIGKEIKFYAGAGLMPQMFTGYRQERQWTTSKNVKESDTYSTKSGYNTFVISALFNIGVTLDFQNGWSLLVSPEARIQLNSSYTSQDSYVHKSRAYGVTFGLTRNF